MTLQIENHRKKRSWKKKDLRWSPDVMESSQPGTNAVILWKSQLASVTRGMGAQFTDLVRGKHLHHFGECGTSGKSS